MEEQEYGELHGTVVENTPCLDEGFNELDRNQSFELEDEVFSLERSTASQSEQNSTIYKVNRQRSSGFVSDFTSIDEDVTLCQQVTTKKHSRDVSCQTDFPIEEEEDEEKYIFHSSPTVSNTFKVNIDGLKLRKFCWKHDDTGFGSPQARPSTPCPDHCNDPQRKVTFVKKSCQTCAQDQEIKIDLKRRKETVLLRKVPVETTVATVKTCDINILHNELTRCSDLWTDSRTFYLGPDVGKITRQITQPKARRSFSKPIRNLKEIKTNELSCPYCNGFQFSNKPLTKQQTCSRHLFWVRTMSLASDKTKPVENSTINKRDWILIQCVTQHPKVPICSNDPEIQLPYREIGEQEMIHCPFANRSLQYIEDICCQHFSNLSKTDTLQSGRRVELLFSPKGPKLREDKNLIGRSIFYFCNDAPIIRSKCSQCILLESGDDGLAVPEFPPAISSRKQTYSSKSKTGKTKARKSANFSSTSRPASANMSNSSYASYTDDVAAFRSTSRLSNEQALNSNAASLQASNMLAQNNASFSMANRNAFNGSHHAVGKNKRKAIEKKHKKPTSAHKKQIPTEQQKPMKKSVHFNEPENDAITTSSHEEKVIDMRRRSSLPPPPKLLSKHNEGTKTKERKRRESVAIMFSAPPEFKQEKPRAPKQPKAAPIREYFKPEWKEINIVVSFKGVKYNCAFPEYKTLQDLYTWTRQQLLQHDVLKPGMDILLVKDNLKFPLKASTANTVISNIPTTVFICEELGEKSTGGGYGDTNSRFDTRFSLPMDIRKLEGLTPIDYLAQFCVVSPTWDAFYKKTFWINDKDRDGKIDYKELSRAMERLFVELSFPLMRRTLFLMAFDPAAWDDVTNSHLEWGDGMTSTRMTSWHNDLYIDSGTFVSMCALANRIMCIENNIDGYPVDSIKQTGNSLEEADFYDIEGKLRESKTEPLTKRLLLYLRRNSR